MQGTLTRSLDWRWAWIALNGLALAFIAAWAVFLVPRMMSVPGVTDAEAYWRLDFGPAMYGEPGEPGAFLYSPVFAQLLAPLTALPFVVFYALLLAANLSALVWMLGPVLAAVAIFLPPVTKELYYGNIHLLIAAAIVAGFRYRGWWSLLPLTKVTPGVAMLYDWRQPRRMLVSFGVLAAIVAVSVVVSPDLWMAWVEMLTTADFGAVNDATLWTHTPAIVRALVAVPLILLAGWKQRPAAVPLIVLYAIPVPWMVSLCLAVAVWPLIGPRSSR